VKFANESAPGLIESWDASLKQPFPEVCRCDPRCGNGPDGLPVECAANVAAGPRAEVQMASPRPNRRLPEGNQR
jgi:hypothetical protein